MIIIVLQVSRPILMVSGKVMRAIRKGVTVYADNTGSDSSTTGTAAVATHETTTIATGGKKNSIEPSPHSSRLLSQKESDLYFANNVSVYPCDAMDQASMSQMNLRLFKKESSNGFFLEHWHSKKQLLNCKFTASYVYTDK